MRVSKKAILSLLLLTTLSTGAFATGGKKDPPSKVLEQLQTFLGLDVKQKEN